MTDEQFRIERDSMGEVRVPAQARYGAQTQRAVENFPISGLRFPRRFIEALALVKWAAAKANCALGLLAPNMAEAIAEAALDVAAGRYDNDFPLDIFQTGSGTSTNMNANEVIATLASERLGTRVHPNDHVNMGQSSNDTIPTAIHVSAYLATVHDLLPALRHLQATITTKAASVAHVVKTGRTHLMDAMPITLAQEMTGWAWQIAHGIERVESALPRLAKLAQGGTAVGTGINAHPEFAARFAALLAERTGLPFRPNDSFFESLSAQDAVVELSGQLKTVAVSLMKIANDLRWMNSGPHAGLAEIRLQDLQPGSSIMPGKVNPVIPEATAMVCAQVIGNDTTITVAGQSGNFQLNVMLPVIAYNILQSLMLLANAARLLADKAIATFTVNEERLAAQVGRNPILVTALNPVIGYELGAKIAKRAYAEDRTVKEVAAEMTSLSGEELDRLLDPRALTEGGIRR
ncbi:MAG: class II fumarate hydratase [Chloracidobacterium sp.]|nr:class II fumarate hydratase [Chloracidobacterium sp.]MDW8218337.1 class II fumarate hydratase [Acidobacteriota bacterium]